MAMGRSIQYDPDKVKELRMKVIALSLDVLNDDPSIEKWSAFKKELVLKIAPRVLPTLNAGRDDDKDLIPQPIIPLNVPINNSNPEDKEPNSQD